MEADQNYAEVERLLGRLDLRVTVRFCRNSDSPMLMQLGTAACFILRDERAAAAGERIGKRTGRPVIPQFPRGLSGCLAFLRATGTACGVSEEQILTVIAEETAHQELMLARFANLSGTAVFLGAATEPVAGTTAVAREVIARLGMQERADGFLIQLPFYLPVGTAGVEKMLYLWRRNVNNG